MPVALDDLGADRVDAQAELGQHLGLEVGREVAVGADRAADLAGGDLGGGPARRSRPRATSNAQPAHLSPNVVGSAWTRVGPAHHHGAGLGRAPGAMSAAVSRSASSARRLPGGPQLERERRVDDVAAGQAEVEVPARRARRSRRPGSRTRSRRGRWSARSRRSGRRRPAPGPRSPASASGGHEAAAGLGAADRELDLEHPLEAGLLGPDGAHLGQRVAPDHAALRPRARQVRGDVAAPLEAVPRDRRPRPARRRSRAAARSRPRPTTVSTRPPFVP